MITDYKYRKLRKIVKTSGVAKPVKELLFCTLRDYKKQGSEPETGTFGSSYVKKETQVGRCLVGAAIHDLKVFDSFTSKIRGDELTWESAAVAAFGVNSSQCSDIITGFDSVTEEEGFVPANKTQRLAYRLGKELGV